MELVRSYGADVVVTRGDRFGSEVRVKVAGGVDALFDTAVLGRDSFSAIRDGGAYVPVRGWDGSPSERDIRIRPVMVMEALTRTDWLNELRDLASSGASRCVSPASTRRSVRGRPPRHGGRRPARRGIIVF